MHYPSIIFSFLLLSFSVFGQNADYLYYVKKHCDNLIEHGKDNYGNVSTNMIASVIDTRDMSVPKANVLRTEWPNDFVVNSLASALQFSLDAHEILGDDRLLESAQACATIATSTLWSGQLFVRQPGDLYYEAKLGTNNLVTGLLRLHLIENDQANEAVLTQWSF